MCGARPPHPRISWLMDSLHKETCSVRLMVLWNFTAKNQRNSNHFTTSTWVAAPSRPIERKSCAGNSEGTWNKIWAVESPRLGRYESSLIGLNIVVVCHGESENRNCESTKLNSWHRLPEHGRLWQISFVTFDSPIYTNNLTLMLRLNDLNAAWRESSQELVVYADYAQLIV